MLGIKIATVELRLGVIVTDYIRAYNCDRD
jgi:hypothetical protein